MTTRTYQEIQKQISELKIEAEQARNRDLAQAREQVRTIMAQVGLKVEDLREVGGGKARKARAPSEPKFRNPETGKTWSGMGRTPQWAKNKNLDDMRINAE